MELFAKLGTLANNDIGGRSRMGQASKNLETSFSKDKQKLVVLECPPTRLDGLANGSYASNGRGKDNGHSEISDPS